MWGSLPLLWPKHLIDNMKKENQPKNISNSNGKKVDSKNHWGKYLNSWNKSYVISHMVRWICGKPNNKHSCCHHLVWDVINQVYINLIFSSVVWSSERPLWFAHNLVLLFIPYLWLQCTLDTKSSTTKVLSLKLISSSRSRTLRCRGSPPWHGLEDCLYIAPIPLS